LEIPISIERLFTKRVVEQSRIEYKKGWNRLEILHTICAFANDIDNLGGGYIVVGVEAQDGLPLLSAEGLQLDSLDRLQKDLLELTRSKIRPQYSPVCDPVEFRGQQLLLIWIPGGYDRPYKAMVSLSEDKEGFAYYVRRYANTVKANDKEIKELHALGEDIPFDDRINRQAKLIDLSTARMIDYLARVESALLKQADEMSRRDLALSLRVASGPAEYTQPLNVGLLLFANDPEDFFREAHIEVVNIPDPTGEGMVERTFNGPIDKQLLDALLYIKNTVVAQMVHKVPGQAEAVRHYNYPYVAIEEALSNAIYHKSYQIAEPITVRIEKDNLSILSIPGPDRSITGADLQNYNMKSKRNRNRRIGDFLKDLDLVEGRNTGVPLMVKALEANGSELPVFETDEDRSYFMTVFKIHDDFKEQQQTTNSELTSDKPVVKRRTREQMREDLRQLLSAGNYSQNELSGMLGYKAVSKTMIGVIKELLAEGTVAYTSESQNDPKAKLTLKRKSKKEIGDDDGAE
jgi:ATP-dependent DNA helicase RecG